MKFCRHGAKGAEQPGLIDAQGRIRDLSGVIADITVQALPGLAGIDETTLPVVDGEPRFGVPVAGIGKIVAIGLNYRDHAIESNLPIPTEPMMFMKALSSVTGPDDQVMLPKGATHGDWEVELGVVIGKTCRYVDRADALDHVAGYVLVNDVSERFNQKQRGSQWSKGKGHDSFCPLGPWLVTPDEIGDPQDLDMALDVNGVRMQTGNTRTMIFPVDELISYVSEYITLEPGDLLITGTPPGVGEGKPNPIFLKPGDTMHLAIAGLGEQTQSVVAWAHPRTRCTGMSLFAGRFAGRTAIITGGASGLGRAVARRIVAEGGRVALWDFNAAGLDAAGRETGAIHVEALNVSDHAAVEAAAVTTHAALGKVDILICSAGITGETAPVHAYPVDSWLQVVDVNLNGLFYCNRAIVPLMLANGYGRIVNVSSVAGKEGNPNASAYSATKAAVIGLTKSLGKELAGKGVIANALTPATFESPILEQLPKAQVDYMRGKIPMGRLGEVEESAAMICFMASEECSFTTASTFDTSGGRTTF